ncbi:MAG: hypothetical protein JSS71_07755 [Armatimonadetes bacterium]|nr:hypothetical protein [Armatimonadota bacterium]MBX3109844.1 hypothetical protein [Fimbriimonadaceae bacterium]
MLVSFLAALPGFKPAPFLLEGMVEAQAKVSKETIDARATMIATKSAADNHFVIQVVRGREARIDFKLTMSNSQEESYYYRVTDSGTVANAYRPVLKQYTESRGNERDLESLVKAATPQLDEFVVSLLTPMGLRAVLAKQDLESPLWTVSGAGANVQIEYKQKDGSAKFVVDRKSLRLQKLAFSNNLGGVVWDFKYSPLTSVKPVSKEPGAYLVAQFDDRLSKMQVTSGAATAAIDTMFRRYDPPNSLAYELTTGREKVTAAFSNSYAYQSDAKVEWGYNGKTLTLRNKVSSLTYFGPATKEDVLAAVAACGSRVDPYLRGLMEGRNPMRRLFSESTGIATKPVANAAEPSVVATAKSPYADLTVTFAKKDGFVLKIESQPVARGMAAPKTVTTFKRINGTGLRLDPPSQARPLSELL